MKHIEIDGEPAAVFETGTVKLSDIQVVGTKPWTDEQKAASARALADLRSALGTLKTGDLNGLTCVLHKVYEGLAAIDRLMNKPNGHETVARINREAELTSEALTGSARSGRPGSSVH